MNKLATLTAVLIICGVYSAQAQLKVAIEGGAHLSSVPGNNNPGWDTVNYRYSTRTGYHMGLLVDLAFSRTSKFHLQSGMNFSNKGRNFSITYDSGTSNITKIEALQYVNYMEMPLNLVFKVKLGKKSNMIFGAGPYAAFLYNGRERKVTIYTNASQDVIENKDLKVAPTKNLYSNFEYGVNGLFGFEFGHFFITGNYSRGLSDFYEPANYHADFRNEVMGGTIGIFLTNPKKSVKQKDTDHDGIPDRDDDCPTTKGDASGKGCPDRDGDGVVDKDDKCPDFPGSPKYGGCPAPDSDKDGVDDEHDKCPLVKGLKNNNGCPPAVDTDKDGVDDEHDKCPTVAGSAKYGGCPPPDSDGDGLNDEIDKCPNAKGTKANDGCPLKQKELINKVENLARRVQFGYRSTKLTTKTKAVLDEVIHILAQNPQLSVFIEGYVSSDGNPENHMKLSQARADAVKDYLLSKGGVDPVRIRAEGFGNANPLNSERTESLRAKNRRVELKLTYN